MLVIVAILINGGADTYLYTVCFVSSNEPYSSSYTFHGHIFLPARNAKPIVRSSYTGIAYETLSYPGIGFACSANVPSAF